jgi:hypothetical protein
MVGTSSAEPLSSPRERAAPNIFGKLDQFFDDLRRR